ncbi:MAG: DNA-binding protein [Clostridia bacterium]|nr:DNA-binding protein [Clostridia bacterium]
MEKNVEISVLCQLYGKVLTEKQYEVLTDYYNNDLSLSEIAENNNITRQAVRDIIKKGENRLYELEDGISLMKKVLQERKIISNITSELNEIKELTNSNKEVVVKINSIEKQLLKLN